MPRHAWLPTSGCNFELTAVAPEQALGDLAAREINAFERDDEQYIVLLLIIRTAAFAKSNNEKAGKGHDR